MYKLLTLFMTLGLSFNSFAGPISDYCTSLVKGEIELEDGADYYATLAENVINPLKEGTVSMNNYAEALEFNIVVLGLGLGDTEHCSLIKDLESNSYELNVRQTTCTGHTKGAYWGETYHESKKATLTFCTTPAFTEGQTSLMTKCDPSTDTLAKVEIDFLESNKEQVTTLFQTGSLNQNYAFDGGESGVQLFMDIEDAPQSFSLESDGEGTGSTFREWKLFNISAPGENQRFNSYNCNSVDLYDL